MQQVQHRIEGAVGVIELSNPPHQFMTQRMVRELDTLTATWESDPRVRAIVITGTHPDTFITHFSVDELAKAAAVAPRQPMSRTVQTALGGLLQGLDRGQRWLDHVPGLRKSVEAAIRKTPLWVLSGLAEIHRVFSRLERMDKAVVAAINGTAMGGGCELALACDYRLMARGDHVIGLVEVLGAIIPGAGGTQRLARTVGQGKAVEMLLDGAVVSPDEAERIGLITRAVDAGALMDEAMKLARRLATRSLGAVGHAKRSVRFGSRLPMDDGLAFEKVAFILAGASPDARKASVHYLESFRAGQTARAIFDRIRAGDGPSFDET
jgi:enoyl-CoA hydratase